MRSALALALLAACGHAGGGSASDARADGPAADAVRVDGHVDDGTPMRGPCTDNFGTALTRAYGRLDGILISIVPPGTGGCNADRDHVHLQVRVDGATYDVAVNVGSSGGVDDVHTTTRELTFPPWSEGWHPGAIEDYVALGVHAADLPLASRTEITNDLMADLATANHITIFATGYGPDGAHLVHREGGGHDGMIVTQPLSSPAHARLFSFSDQNF
jgi:hypothetical protein